MLSILSILFVPVIIQYIIKNSNLFENQPEPLSRNANIVTTYLKMKYTAKIRSPNATR